MPSNIIQLINKLKFFFYNKQLIKIEQKKTFSIKYNYYFYAGIDIGYSCTHDVQCTLGNGGEYSKCNKDLNICICTINHLGISNCLLKQLNKLNVIYVL